MVEILVNPPSERIMSTSSSRRNFIAAGLTIPVAGMADAPKTGAASLGCFSA